MMMNEFGVPMNDAEMNMLPPGSNKPHQRLIAESGLRKGDTPFEYIGQLASKSKNNESYSLEGNPTGVVEIKNGFALIMESGGKYLAQQFNFSGDMLREKGRLSNVSSKIEKYEAEYFIDFNGDGVIAGGE